VRRMRLKDVSHDSSVCLSLFFLFGGGHCLLPIRSFVQDLLQGKNPHEILHSGIINSNFGLTHFLVLDVWAIPNILYIMPFCGRPLY
jgi:hypothetical protein